MRLVALCIVGVLAVAFLLGFFMPLVALLPCVAMVVAVTALALSGPLRTRLALSSGVPAWIPVTAAAAMAVLLLVSSVSGFVRSARQARAEEAEAALVRDAEAASAMALEAARKLVGEGRAAMASGKWEEARQLLLRAQAKASAAGASALLDELERSGSAKAVRACLESLDDAELQAIGAGAGVLSCIPSSMESTRARALAIAAPMVASVLETRAKDRARLAAEQAEREARAAAEAARAAADAARTKQETDARAAAEQAKIDAEFARLNKKCDEQLVIGSVAWQVDGGAWTTDLSPNEFLNKKPDAEYLFIRLSVVNLGKSPCQLPAIRLTDEAGRIYEPTPSAALVEGALLPFERLNPSVQKRGWVVFDVPRFRLYRMVLTGPGWLDETGYVTINKWVRGMK